MSTDLPIPKLHLNEKLTSSVLQPRETEGPPTSTSSRETTNVKPVLVHPPGDIPCGTNTTEGLPENNDKVLPLSPSQQSGPPSTFQQSGPFSPPQQSIPPNTLVQSDAPTMIVETPVKPTVQQRCSSRIRRLPKWLDDYKTD